ncbi:MAG: Pyruvate carboxyltransferase protein [Thermodesulfobacteriota bacterium]|nr:Pyruvate carboxyltransferase protein [Thermodesulfobacteriota bacterium]
MDRVIITDVTLREFGQNVPGTHLHIFTPEMRASLALELMDLGFPSIEVLSCIHPKVAPAMHEEAIRKISTDLGRMDRVHIITLVPNLTGYSSFLRLDLGPDGFNHTLGIFFSAVEAHNLANLGRPVSETIAEYRTILKDAASRHIRVVAYISAAFGYRDPGKGEVIRAGLVEIARHMDLLFDQGARTVTLSDLQGVAGKDETARILETILDLRKGRDRDRIGYHPHHVSGDQALANSQIAFDLGLRRFDASLGGTGGCVTGAPGNQPTERLIHLFNELEVQTGIDEDSVIALAERVRRDLYERIPLSRSLPRNEERRGKDWKRGS